MTDVSPPGETLKELIKHLNLSQSKLAEKLKCSESFVDDLIKGNANLTNEIAFNLEHVFKIPASFWINRELNYRNSLKPTNTP